MSEKGVRKKGFLLCCKEKQNRWFIVCIFSIFYMTKIKNPQNEK